MHAVTRVLAGREVEKELATAGPREEVGDAHAGKRLGLLVHQDVEGPPDLAGVVSIDEAHLENCRREW